MNVYREDIATQGKKQNTCSGFHSNTVQADELRENVLASNLSQRCKVIRAVPLPDVPEDVTYPASLLVCHSSHPYGRLDIAQRSIAEPLPGGECLPQVGVCPMTVLVIGVLGQDRCHEYVKWGRQDTTLSRSAHEAFQLIRDTTHLRTKNSIPFSR